MLKVVGASWNKVRASTWIIGIVFVFGIAVVILGELGQSDEDGNWSATLYWSRESGFEIVFWGQGKKIDEIPKGVARAYYRSHVNTTGWAILDIETQAGYPDWVQAFAAGMLEGSLTWQMIHWQKQNTLEQTCVDDERLCQEMKSYVLDNWEWVKQMYGNKTGDPYWHQIHLFYLQVEGLQRGYEQGVKRSRVQDVDEMTVEDFLFLNAISDMDDLKHKFSNEYIMDRDKFFDALPQSTFIKKLSHKRSIRYSLEEQTLSTESEKPDNHDGRYKCGYGSLSLSSAFVKLVLNKRKLYIAHNSAGQYSTMLKMMKHYQFSYRKGKRDRDPVPGKRITFSSYPGVIHSTDDFFIIQNDDTEQELVVTGTSLPIFNRSLWQTLSPQGQVVIGPRVMAASRLASNAREWPSILSKFNSGTGNNQWIIADFMKFAKIAAFREESEDKFKNELSQADGVLYIAEQIPGVFEIADETKTLSQTTYWASYGLPFFKNVSHLSGVDDMVLKFGDVYSYDNTPIAKIFRRDHVKATSMDSVAQLMRSNSYKTDPFSYKNPRCAIGSRGDLANDAQETAPIGVTDTKVFSSKSVVEAPLQTQKTDRPDKVNQKQETRLEIKAGPPYSDSWNTLNRTLNESGSNGIRDGLPGDDPISPFIWPESEFRSVSHLGHPDVWNFKPIIIF